MSQRTRSAIAGLALVLSGCLIDTVGQDPDSARGGESALGGDDSGSGAGGEVNSQGGQGGAHAGGAGGGAPSLSYQEKRCADGEVGLRFERDGDEVKLVCGAPDVRGAAEFINDGCELNLRSVFENDTKGTSGASEASARGRSCLALDGTPLQGCQARALGSTVYNVARVAVQRSVPGVSRSFQIDFACQEPSVAELACDDASRVLTGRGVADGGVCRSVEALTLAAAASDCRFSFGADADRGGSSPAYWGTSFTTGCEVSDGGACSMDHTAVIPWFGVNYVSYAPNAISAGFSCAPGGEAPDTEAESKCPEGTWVVGQTSNGALKCAPPGDAFSAALSACQPVLLVGLDCAENGVCWGEYLYDGETEAPSNGPFELNPSSPRPVVVLPDYTLGNWNVVPNDYVGIGFRCTP